MGKKNNKNKGEQQRAEVRTEGSLTEQYHSKLKELFESSSEGLISTSEQEQNLGKFPFGNTFDLVGSDSRHKVTLSELIEAVAKDFGDFAFCPNYFRRAA